MGNQYREDPDLDFLEYADEDDLKVLATYLTRDADGDERLTEELLRHERFQALDRDSMQHKKCWDLIAAELQYFGGDTLVNIFRRSGVLYREILCDVCDKLKVNYNKKHSTDRIELSMMQKLVEDSWEKMSEEDRRELLKQVNIDAAVDLGGAAGLAAIQAAIRMGGFAAYKTTLIIANAVAKQLIGRGLTLAANAGLAKGLAVLAGPIGILVTVLLTLPAISGPAYRVTIPSVIQIAYMRQKMMQKEAF